MFVINAEAQTNSKCVTKEACKSVCEKMKAGTTASLENCNPANCKPANCKPGTSSSTSNMSSSVLNVISIDAIMKKSCAPASCNKQSGVKVNNTQSKEKTKTLKKSI
jgi:hypothetical protein